MIVAIENVQKHFHGVPALNDISLQVRPGELVALIGPSGCGKSTLLRCINGLEAVDQGRIQVLDTELRAPAAIGQKEFNRRALSIRKNAGMVFQSFNLFPHMTVLENVARPQIVVRGRSRDQAQTTAVELLRKVGLSDKAIQYPSKLSGGQQQRAAIARALAMNPKILLYDEPTSALDPTLVNEVLQVMKQLISEGMTQIVVTHEMAFARDVADRIVYIEHGRIVEAGTPQEIFGGAKDERTRNFLRHLS